MPKKIIAIDFGNSRKKAALFIDGNLAEVIVFSTNFEQELLQTTQQFKPDNIVIASVVHFPEELLNDLRQQFPVHLVSHQSKLPFNISVNKPNTVGSDRLALCAAAVSLFQDKHILAISLGTCITYNFVNNQQQFLGGAISPGLQMRFNALHQQTAALPLETYSNVVPFTGFDTKTNIQSGVIIGMAKEIEGFIQEYQLRYDDLQVVFTGGDAEKMLPFCNTKYLMEENLLFWGLKQIADLN